MAIPFALGTTWLGGPGDSDDAEPAPGVAASNIPAGGLGTPGGTLVAGGLGHGTSVSSGSNIDSLLTGSGHLSGNPHARAMMSTIAGSGHISGNPHARAMTSIIAGTCTCAADITSFDWFTSNIYGQLLETTRAFKTSSRL